MNAEKVADVLFRAADRVQFKGWTRYSYAITSSGAPVGARDPEAVAWCLRGALRAETWPRNRLYEGAAEALREFLDVGNLMLWNDMQERTAGEVADAMRCCAKGLLEASQP